MDNISLSLNCLFTTEIENFNFMVIAQRADVQTLPQETRAPGRQSINNCLGNKLLCIGHNPDQIFKRVVNYPQPEHRSKIFTSAELHSSDSPPRRILKPEQTIGRSEVQFCLPSALGGYLFLC